MKSEILNIIPTVAPAVDAGECAAVWRRWSQCMSAVFFTVALVSCGQKSPPTKAQDLSSPKLVKTIKAEVKPMERIVVATGSFLAREQSTLSTKVSGRLESIAVDTGSVVRKGDKLAQIDLADYELRVRQAEAVLSQARAAVGLPADGDRDAIDIDTTAVIRQAKALLNEAKVNLDRVKQLALEKIAPQSELDTAEAAHAVAAGRYQDALEDVRGRQAVIATRRAELNLASKQLSDSTIRAPFDGIVHERLASPGEFMAAGAPLLILADVDPLRLRLEVPELESISIRPGQPVRVTVGRSTNIYSAQINRVSPVLRAANRMLVVEADVPRSPALRPGLFAQAEIVVSSEDPALCVPPEAVASFVGIQKVFVMKDGKAHEKGVTTGRRTLNFIEVLTGLTPGETIILNPGKLRSQQPVVEEVNAASR
jgi:RND family efflux transporter MFP subunit